MIADTAGVGVAFEVRPRNNGVANPGPKGPGDAVVQGGAGDAVAQGGGLGYSSLYQASPHSLCKASDLEVSWRSLVRGCPPGHVEP